MEYLSRGYDNDFEKLNHPSFHQKRYKYEFLTQNILDESPFLCYNICRKGENTNLHRKGEDDD